MGQQKKADDHDSLEERLEASVSEALAIPPTSPASGGRGSRATYDDPLDEAIDSLSHRLEHLFKEKPKGKLEEPPAAEQAATTPSTVAPAVVEPAGGTRPAAAEAPAASTSVRPARPLPPRPAAQPVEARQPVARHRSSPAGATTSPPTERSGSDKPAAAEAPSRPVRMPPPPVRPSAVERPPLQPRPRAKLEAPPESRLETGRQGEFASAQQVADVLAELRAMNAKIDNLVESHGKIRSTVIVACMATFIAFIVAVAAMLA